MALDLTHDGESPGNTVPANDIEATQSTLAPPNPPTHLADVSDIIVNDNEDDSEGTIYTSPFKWLSATSTVGSTCDSTSVKDDEETDENTHSECASEPPVYPWDPFSSAQRYPYDPTPRKSPLEQLMVMVGLEDAKAQFLAIKARVESAIRRKEDLSKERFDILLIGNLGTGKRVVAQLYENFLYSLGAVRPSSLHLSGFHIKSLNSFAKVHDKYIFIDNAHEIPSEDRVLDAFLLDTDDNNILIFEGHKEGLDAFESDEARWRIPTRIYFKDYSDDELLQIAIRMFKKRSLVVEGGFDGAFLRTFVRRIGRGRGEDSYGNIRTLQTEFAKACLRQAERLEEVSKRLAEDGTDKSHGEDDFFLTGFDLLGSEPSDIRHNSVAWKKLQGMVGLESVKEEMEELVLRSKTNYHREMQELEPIRTTLHRVFLGPPGTGKTTVAALYGQILAELGLLSSGDIVIKKPTDFIGEYIGQSEAMTKIILESTWGKVLIIDEAHMLYKPTVYGTDDSDGYRRGIIDSIVAHVDSNPSDDRCIILIGYPDRMQELFQSCNPGLRRRFPLEEAFLFEDYNDATLGLILDHKLSRDQIAATEEAKRVAQEVLSRARDRPNFGNGGEVENLLGLAKSNHNKRVRSLAKKRNQNVDTHEEVGIKIVLEPQDFDPEYNRGSDAIGNCRALFKGLVGFDDTIERFEGYQKMAAGMRLHGVDPRLYIPFTYVFKGPPGTGKTTTARVMGKIFYDMGFLSTAEVIECSATDLIGEYLGQTGPKVISLLDRALGKVLFIDEAYRLGDVDAFTNYNTDAVGELVDCLTKTRYARKLIIVLAGYTGDMDRLMYVNRGLRSRFETDVVFPHMTPEHCLRLLRTLIGKLGIKITAPDTDRSGETKTLFTLFSQLSQTKGWANGRDVETLSREVIGNVFKNQGMLGGKAADQLTVSMNEIIGFLREMHRRRVKGEQQAGEL